MNKELEFFTPEAFQKGHDEMVEKLDKEWERVKYRIDLAKRYNELLKRYDTDNKPTPEESLAISDEIHPHIHRVEGGNGQCVFFDCKLVGYWKSNCLDKVARRKEAEKLIDKEWAETYQAKYVIKYMKVGYKTIGYFGHASNVLWDETDKNDTSRFLGTCDMMSPDGKWQYPEKWWVYVEKYGVKPDNEQFIKDAIIWCRFNAPEDSKEHLHKGSTVNDNEKVKVVRLKRKENGN